MSQEIQFTIIANVVHVVDSWRSSTQIPMFHVWALPQMVEHKVLAILDPLRCAEAVHASWCEVDTGDFYGCTKATKQEGK